MRIKVLRNVKKPWSRELELELIAFLESNGFETVKKDADVTLCIGGDGTIFHFNHMHKIEGPILAIGSRSSVVCQLNKDNWKTNILPYLKRNRFESRITLSATLGKKSFSAINDVVLHTVDYRVITTTVEINRKRHSFEGDGVIIATPTGSTAYAYSAGGLVIDEEVGAIEVVPICPYLRRFSPRIIHDSGKLKISSDRVADLIIDGIFIKKLRSNEVTEVEKGNNIMFLV